MEKKKFPVLSAIRPLGSPAQHSLEPATNSECSFYDEKWTTYDYFIVLRQALPYSQSAVHPKSAAGSAHPDDARCHRPRCKELEL